MKWLCLGVLLSGCVQDSVLDGDGDGQLPIASGGTDCNDDDPTIFLGGQEICGNLIDEDCDGLVDEDGVGELTWFEDQDRDGYGRPNSLFRACTQPEGYAENNDDCNDGDSDVSPGQVDASCDGVDNNCSGTKDEDAPTRTLYRDRDGDRFGDPSDTFETCLEQRPGYVDNALDCDDGDSEVNPDEIEVCNGVDDNCDGDTDGAAVGDAAMCAATSCEEIHRTRPDTGNGLFWVRNQANSGVPIQVECAQLRDRRGFMVVDLPWIRDNNAWTFETGGHPGAKVTWSDDFEPVPILDTVHVCTPWDIRWARFQVQLPYPVKEVAGSWVLQPELSIRPSEGWRGVDNVDRPYGGSFRPSGSCGDGAVLFGSTTELLKFGGEWGSPWTLPTIGLGRCPDNTPCNEWSVLTPLELSRSDDVVRWEIQGTSGDANPTARITNIELYIR